MINEASQCLEENIVGSSSELDLAMIMGTGFPPFRGGLLRYADSIGISKLVEKLRGYEKRLGARYQPSEAIQKRAQNQVPFYTQDSAR